jgi:fucose 4-O-acetylase-like acetyltransferase
MKENPNPTENKKTPEPKSVNLPQNALRTSFLIFLMVLFISAALISVTYTPWKKMQPYISACTEPASAIIVEDGSQEKDGNYYYGPKVEYMVSQSGMNLRVKAVNTVNLNTKWEENTAVAVYYNPDNPTEVILRNDNTAENHYRVAVMLSAVLIALSISSMATIAVISLMRKKPKKYRSNIAGQTFEEWQKKAAAESDGTTEDNTTENTDE